MIAGRPTNLWLGLTTAISGAVMVTAVALGADPAVVAILGGAWGGALGSAILLISNQPPTLNPGDTFTTVTPKGQPNYQTTVATPPAADEAPVPAA